MSKQTVAQKVAAATEKLLAQDSSAVIGAVLNGAFWPNTLETRVGYHRISDDTSGDITVAFGPDADAWIEILSRLDPKEVTTMHRFRTYFGGGESERVRNALLILAIAIKLDNEARPQSHRHKLDDST